MNKRYYPLRSQFNAGVRMKGPNISIIVLDTLRLDAFNALLDREPSLLEGLGAVRFENCIAPASWTLPSHASLFTGLYPSRAGAHETKTIKSLDIERIRLRKGTVVDDLRSAGYSTYGISANPYIHPVYGFTGFDEFVSESYFTDVLGSVVEVSERLKPKVAKYRNIHGNDIVKLSKAIMREDPGLFMELAASAATLTPKAALSKMRAKLIEGWPIEKGGRNIINKVADMRLAEPFFLFANFMEAHDPYIGGKGMDMNWATPFLKEQPPASLVSKWQSLYRNASRRALRYGTELARDLIGRFGEDQIIMLTSDHGQAFNEHGFIGHGTVLFDEVVRVPLVVIAPKRMTRNAGRAGYQSLANVRRFVNAAASGEADALSKLSSKSVYAETFSIPANISNLKGLDSRKIARFDKYQKRVFK
jgi:hypothetical protein